MKVVVPHAPRITAETVAALKAFWPSYDPVNVGTDRLAYWRLLCQLWADGQDFILIEHDIVPTAEVFRQFRWCPSAWCTFGYYQHDAKGPTALLLTASLGCARFRPDLMVERPDLMVRAGQRDMGSGPGHWARLDQAVAAELAPLEPCVHEPPVGHVLRPR